MTVQPQRSHVTGPRLARDSFQVEYWRGESRSIHCRACRYARKPAGSIRSTGRRSAVACGSTCPDRMDPGAAGGAVDRTGTRSACCRTAAGSTRSVMPGGTIAGGTRRGRTSSRPRPSGRRAWCWPRATGTTTQATWRRRTWRRGASATTSCTTGSTTGGSSASRSPCAERWATCSMGHTGAGDQAAKAGALVNRSPRAVNAERTDGRRSVSGCDAR